MEIQAIQDLIFRPVSRKSPLGPDLSLRKDEIELQAGAAHICASRTVVMVSHCSGKPSTIGPQSYHPHSGGKPQSSDPVAAVFAKSDRLWFTPRIDVCPTIDIYV